MSTPPKHFRPEPFAYHEIIELEIDSLSNLGAGVYQLDLDLRSERGPIHIDGELPRIAIDAREARVE